MSGHTGSAVAGRGVEQDRAFERKFHTLEEPTAKIGEVLKPRDKAIK